MDAPFTFFFDEGKGNGFAAPAAVLVEAFKEEFDPVLSDRVFPVKGIMDPDFGALAGGVPPVEGSATAFESVLVAFCEGGFPGDAVAFHGGVVV